jgi:hypothetical protein
VPGLQRLAQNRLQDPQALQRRRPGRLDRSLAATLTAVGLKAAREKCHEAEKLRDQGQDPAAAREVRRQENETARHTFRAVGQEWLTTKLEKENNAKATIKRETWNLGQLYREIGDKKLCEIEPPDLLAAPQSGGVLGAVKDKPCRARKRASLTAPALARDRAGRDGETRFKSNKETDLEG